MSPRLPWLVTRDTPALRHMADLTLTLGRAVQTVAQVPGSHGRELDRVEQDLLALDASASASLMAFLTALRSAFVTPLPRQDLYLLAGGVHSAVQRVVGAGRATRVRSSAVRPVLRQRHHRDRGGAVAAQPARRRGSALCV